ncbi:MAG: VRR-NUC domain-containing protein [Candidatus Cloacimonadaceae bacterium]|jgi:hypothetical protein
MREQQIEQQLRLMTKARGGLCLKFVSPGWNGAPDRIVLFPDGKAGFVEVKSPGKKPRKIQLLRHQQLRRLGFQVFVLDKTDDIGGILDGIQGT